MLVHDTEWLIELLSRNRSIHLRDGLGTFISKTNDGWRICGRDDVKALLEKTLFDDLSFCLKVAKTLKSRFDKHQKLLEKK